MPGAAHLFYGLGNAIFLAFATRGEFLPRHAFVYVANNFVGPDIGSLAEFFLQRAAPRLGTLLMNTAHGYFSFCFLVAPVLALLYRFLASLVLTSITAGSGGNGKWCWPLAALLPWRVSRTALAPSYAHTLALVIAGGLSHFCLEVLFEENGSTDMYQWILSTGYWRPIPDVLQLGAVVFMGGSIVALLLGFLWIHGSRAAASLHDRWRRTLWLVLGTLVVYSVYLSYCVFLRYPRQPAVGEEADLGVLVFLALFVFLPLALCLWVARDARAAAAPADHSQDEWATATV